MRLADAQTLILAMGVGSNTGSENNAARALNFSFPIIENILETRLEEGSRIDYFNFYGRYDYRLTNAFIDPDSLVVRESVDGYELKTPTAGDIVDPADYYVDAERGVLFLRRAVLRGTHTLSVAYDHGLPVSDDSEEVLVAPEWLKEAAIAAGLMTINVTPSVNGSSKSKISGNKQVDEIRLLLRQHLIHHLRPRMGVCYPSRTEDNG